MGMGRANTKAPWWSRIIIPITYFHADVAPSKLNFTEPTGGLDHRMGCDDDVGDVWGHDNDDDLGCDGDVEDWDGEGVDNEGVDDEGVDTEGVDSVAAGHEGDNEGVAPSDVEGIQSGGDDYVEEN
uniref:Uncharacterized protein n=1 Tax=Nelumbo nucifera TaxID=4432 RepID=A0A822ZEI6_NELNU|nr:TPA_asm: hypothetical protein HUJ06_014341 [Nelumbo nucifera]